MVSWCILMLPSHAILRKENNAVALLVLISEKFYFFFRGAESNRRYLTAKE